MNPVSVPAVVARRFNSPVPPPVIVERISRPAEDKAGPQTSQQSDSDDEYAVPLVSDDPVSWLQAILRPEEAPNLVQV
jgi:hypothetical protein